MIDVVTKCLFMMDISYLSRLNTTDFLISRIFNQMDPFRVPRIYFRENIYNLTNFSHSEFYHVARNLSKNLLDSK